MLMEIQVLHLDRHKTVAGLKCLVGSQHIPSWLLNPQWQYNVCLIIWIQENQQKCEIKLWCPLRFLHNTMFGSSLYLPLFVWGFMSYLRYLCLFAYSGVQHILCCIFVLFIIVLYGPCCQFLWIVYFWLPLLYSLKFINLNDEISGYL